MDASALENAISIAEKSFDFWSFWLLITTLTVVVGLVVEYFPAVKKLLTERPVNRMLLIEMVGGVLVTVGVAGELGVQFFQSGVETNLRNANHQYVALLEKETEAQRAANLKLEAEIQPREFSLEQKQALGAVFSKLKGEAFVIRSILYDVEGTRLATQIEEAFKQGGIAVAFNPILVPAPIMLGGAWKFAAGVRVSGPATKTITINAIANALRDIGKLTFVTCDLRAAMSDNLLAAPGDNASVTIDVGPKPISE